MGILAYTLGLRHAFDADHIALLIIQSASYFNKTKSCWSWVLLLYRSLNCCVLMSVLLGISVKWAKDELPYFQNIGGIIGTLVSGFFLLLIGILNLFILISLIKLLLDYVMNIYEKKN